MAHSDSVPHERPELEASGQVGAKRQKLTPPSERDDPNNNHPLGENNADRGRGVDDSLLRGKVFAITGGASGIGLATAKILSRRGAAVCIADVDPAAMKSADAYFSKAGAPYLVTRVDVSRRAEVDGWIDAVVRKFGRLDGAANVAGVIGKAHGSASVAELEDEEWDKIIAVNLTGMMYCLRAQLRNIVDGGSIVNTSSIHGLKGEIPTDLPSCSFFFILCFPSFS